MHKSINRALALAAVGVLLIFQATPAFALTPVTMNSSSQAQAINNPVSRLVCYTNGYFYAFQVQSTNNIVYQSSQLGVIWSSVTNTAATVPAVSEMGLYCDQSGNVYLVSSSGGGATQFAYRRGTALGGVITWSFSPLALNCVDGGTICGEYPSIYAFDVSHVWISMRAVDGGSTPWTEVWSCQTAPCSTSGNWAVSLDDSTHPCNGGCPILGLSSTANLAVVEAPSSGTLSIRTTSNSGSSWAAAVTSVQQYTGLSFGCVSVSSTVYCALVESTASKSIYFSTFVQGAGSWTENTIQTFSSALSVNDATISTDGTRLQVYYATPNSTSIDLQTSPNLGGTWSGDLAWISGEPSAVSNLVATPRLVSTIAGVMWQLATSNNIRFLYPGGLVLLYAQNFPSPAIMAFFVLVFVALFLLPSILVSLFKGQGDVVVTIWLLGSFLAGLLGSLAATEADILAGSYGDVPWGMTFFLGFALVVWLVKGGGH